MGLGAKAPTVDRSVLRLLSAPSEITDEGGKEMQVKPAMAFVAQKVGGTYNGGGEALSPKPKLGCIGIMEKNMETAIMENQMEKKMENEMETGIIMVYI